METNTTNIPEPIAPEPQIDPRPAYAKAGALAATVIAAVEPATLRAPTPCSEFDVEALTRHLLSVGHRTLAMGRGETAESIPLDAPGVASEDFAADWANTMTNQAIQWADDRLLGLPVVLPFATLPGAVMLSIYTAEILVHTWDLATALDVEPEWDDEIVTDAIVTLQMGIPAEGRGPDMPFDPVRPTADDAPPIHRLVAWVGRTP